MVVVVVVGGGGDEVVDGGESVTNNLQIDKEFMCWGEGEKNESVVGFPLFDVLRDCVVWIIVLYGFNM